MHLSRLIYKSPVIISDKMLPLWISGIGFIIFLLLYSPISLSLGDPMTLKLKSSAFNDGGYIPSKYTCQGDDISPPLSWQDAPKNTKSFVLILDDPDAPSGNWDHWIIFNIPETTHALPENLSSLPNGTQHGKNSWGKSAYGGPCPPPNEEHRYYFKLYALDTFINIPAGATKSQIETIMHGHILASTKLMGLYKK